MKRLISRVGLILMVSILLVAPLAGCSNKKYIKQWTAPPEMQIDINKTYFAVFDTSLGTFKVELWAKAAPKTVNNFVFLAQEDFYNSLIFHRIVKNFMIQSGDPEPYKGSDFKHGPGYKFDDELPPAGIYEPGIIAMANAGPNTNGSQFFICTGNSAYTLEEKYTQFGRVVEGMDVVLKIAAVDVIFYGGEFGKPKNPPVIKSITIISN